jgi:hypothetical protein
MGSEEDRRDQGSEFEPRDSIKHGPETMTELRPKAQKLRVGQWWWKSR